MYQNRYIHASQITKWFRVHQDIVAKRMDLARTLIRRDGMSVKEAAYLCGYKSRVQFSSAFRSRFGGNPGDGTAE